MSVSHHPSDGLLTAYAAGTLDLGQHVAVATHLVSCPHCRKFVADYEHVGGETLSALPPSSLAAGALARAELLLDGAPRPLQERRATTVDETDVPGLPAFVRRFQFDRWHWVAPSVHVRPISLPHPSATRVFLLKSGGGTRMLEHAHTGSEMTCVLSGAFRQGGHLFRPGDFDLGDDAIDHQPMVEPGEDCICLVAMQGALKLKGLLGRIVQPFVRL